jgi:hypothetical protein
VGSTPASRTTWIFVKPPKHSVKSIVPAYPHFHSGWSRRWNLGQITVETRTETRTIGDGTEGMGKDGLAVDFVAFRKNHTVWGRKLSPDRLAQGTGPIPTNLKSTDG